MKAMIFAAGLGSRLKPLTNNKPKALVQLNGKPLLQILIERLKTFGIREIIINAHHFADQISHFIQTQNQFNIKVDISQETKLLDTGGGLKKASWFFEDGQPFLLHNVDVLTDLNYELLLDAHQSSAALATLAVRKRKTNRYFLFDENMRLSGWQSLTDGQKRMVRSNEANNPYSFMGIHIISPQIFKLFPQQDVFSIVHAYLDIAERGYKINALDASSAQWLDVGRKEHLDQAAGILNQTIVS